MPHGLNQMFQQTAALLVGGMIGVAFGYVQDVARRRNEKRQAEGKLNNGWQLMPGSGARVAYLLIALVAIQLVCPLMFRDGTQWWVSGGLVAGYGVVLFLQLRRRMSAGK
jgi:hypothetical protein